jgi:serine protease Do
MMILSQIFGYIKNKEASMSIKIRFKGNKNPNFFRSLIIFIAFFSVSTLSLAADKIPGSFSELVKKAGPSVVNVSMEKMAQVGVQMSPFGTDDPFNDFFNRFYGNQGNQGNQGTQRKVQGVGTGFIIDKEGYILTNNHVVDGADKITVKLSDNKQYTAKVIGLDSKTDLALIKIDGAKDLVPLTLGDSDKMEVGDWVVAIGNPFGLDNTVTAGIISAKYRRNIGTSSYENYIQTDAAINQGNSGGPLMNTNGEVIGINSAILSQTGGSVGIGFSIPINMAKDLLPQLKKGKIIRGWLGVMIQSITPDLQNKLGLKDVKGALVGSVTEDGPAEKAGVETGDVIVSFDGKDINEMSELPLLVASTSVGKNVKLGIIRKGEKKTLDIKVGELKDDEEASQTTGGGSVNGTNLGFKAGEITADKARQLKLSEKSGVIILQVDDGSPAEEAGLQAGDIVIEVDREKVTDLTLFNKKIRGYKAGDTILFLVKRSGSSLFLTLKVEK